MSEDRFAALTDAQELDRLFARSHDAPVVLFKHSLTCPISRTAYEEMRRLDEPVAMVVVQRARGVSNEIAARTGVRHETPQALVLRRGGVVWSASHWDVTAEAVTRAVRESAA